MTTSEGGGLGGGLYILNCDNANIPILAKKKAKVMIIPKLLDHVEKKIERG